MQNINELKSLKVLKVQIWSKIEKNEVRRCLNRNKCMIIKLLTDSDLHSTAHLACYCRQTVSSSPQWHLKEGQHVLSSILTCSFSTLGWKSGTIQELLFGLTPDIPPKVLLQARQLFSSSCNCLSRESPKDWIHQTDMAVSQMVVYKNMKPSLEMLHWHLQSVTGHQHTPRWFID